jgi:hypothetical protein
MSIRVGWQFLSLCVGMKRARRLVFLAALTAMASAFGGEVPPSGLSAEQGWHEIQVVDSRTGRGVPLVELETVDHLRFVTDSAGRVAFREPGLMNQTVFFFVRSYGYEMTPDGFGMAGRRIETRPGGKTVLEVERVNVAERMYRITGAGIYRDSVLLGKPVPLAEPLLNAQVLGQDGAQTAIYRGKLYWFWGDTARLSYPLGNFRTTGAVSDLPTSGGLNPADGVNLRYFTGPEGFVKQMCPLEPRDGLVWMDGLLVVSDERGRERLVAHFMRLKGLGEMLEHGLAVFKDEKEEFDRLASFKFEEQWQCPRGHSFRHREADSEFFYFCTPFPNVRVKADLAALVDSASYEAWSCIADDSDADPKKARLERDGDGRPVYRWTREAPPVGPKEEQEFIQAGLMDPGEARFLPSDIETGKPVQMHSGTVRWNPWRKRWILIAVQIGGDKSFLGEVWYAESPEALGPWRRARKIVTHNRYTFYNPVHHDFFDEAGGRLIYFEGTYSNSFSGNPDFTPRYDYNQIMYRLDLSDPRLKEVHEESS